MSLASGLPDQVEPCPDGGSRKDVRGERLAVGVGASPGGVDDLRADLVALSAECCAEPAASELRLLYLLCRVGEGGEGGGRRIAGHLDARRDRGRRIIERAIASGDLGPSTPTDLMLDLIEGAALGRSLGSGPSDPAGPQAVVDLVLGLVEA